jgi:biotin carboxyl carrier protein
MKEDVRLTFSRGNPGAEIVVPGEEVPFRILSWNPPRLILARGDEVRAFFVAPAKDGVWIGAQGHTHFVERPSRRRALSTVAAPEGHDDLSSPMPGRVLEVLVAEGETVESGQRLIVVEAMKMETPLRAPHRSVVTRIHVAPGDGVVPGETLIELEVVS